MDAEAAISIIESGSTRRHEHWQVDLENLVLSLHEALSVAVSVAIHYQPSFGGAFDPQLRAAERIAGGLDYIERRAALSQEPQ